jgi:anti-sigma factor RsiW
MSCEELRAYLPAYLDNELEVADIIRIEQHLAECADCRGARDQAMALRTALTGADLYERPASGLERKVRGAVRAEAGGARWVWPAWVKWIPVAGALAAGVFGTLLLTRGLAQRTTIAGDIVTSHIRSLEADHLVDVKSSDQHTVKPWFQGKLDFSPPVPDLSARGWELVGGRMDYAGGRAVAALVYRRRNHEINVFVWPAQGGGKSSIREREARGYQILEWNSGGMSYWAISDLNRAELTELAHALRGD